MISPAMLPGTDSPMGFAWEAQLRPAMPAHLLASLVERAYRNLLQGDASGALRTLEHALATAGWHGSQLPDSFSERQLVPRVSLAAHDASHSARTVDCIENLVEQRIHVRTLGSFDVLLDGVSISSGRKHPRRTLALLQALIAFGGRQVSRTALTDALWPDADGDQAHNALEAALHRLRLRLVVAGAIVSKHGCLDIDPKHVWVDALVFDTANPLQPGTTDCSSHIERAFELYRGAFLREDEANWWTVRSRERLRSRFVGVVAGAAASMEAYNRFDAAAQLYERAIVVDDLVCVFHEGLIRCLRRLGRQAEAETALQRKQKLVAAGIC